MGEVHMDVVHDVFGALEIVARDHFDRRADRPSLARAVLQAGQRAEGGGVALAEIGEDQAVRFMGGIGGEFRYAGVKRFRFRRLLDWGLVDLFRQLHPELQAFSWWDYRGGAFHKGEGLRIDLLLGTRTLLPRVREVAIDRDYRKKKGGLTASDHAPVIADLD